MNNQNFTFHLQSAVLLIGIGSCALDETTEQIVERPEHASQSIDGSSAPLVVQTGSGAIDFDPAATSEGSRDPLQGDFNGDGYADLAIGVPGEQQDGVQAGAVAVLYGSNAGLSANGNQLISRATAGGEDPPAPGDEFGRTLAIGDFNADGFADLAIGAPFHEIANVEDAGSVTVIDGSPTGLDVDARKRFALAVPRLGANYGYALTTGDFNDDGRDDLAIGVPGSEVSGQAEAGRVNVLYGSAHGLTLMAETILDQGTPGVTGLVERNDRFGSTLAAGDFDGDGSDDLVIGVPKEDIGSKDDAGWVHVLYGSPASAGRNAGMMVDREEIWHQGITGIEGSPDAFDELGHALAVGDFDGDGRDDLAIGVPGEEVSSKPDAGAVNTLYGSSTGLTESDDQVWHQDMTGIEGEADVDERFGESLAAGDFDDDGHDDLAIGAPGEDFMGQANAGQVQVLYGKDSGLSADDDERWHQNTEGIEGVANGEAQFGHALTTGDYDGDGVADLTIGVAFENVGSRNDAGAIHVIYGDDSQELWHQDSEGVLDDAEPGDMFGFDVP
jgi:hypothetical protein